MEYRDEEDNDDDGSDDAPIANPPSEKESESINLMEELLKLKTDDDEIAEALLDYEKVDKRVYKLFLDIGMVACCPKSFVHDMAFVPDKTFKNTVTVPEEAFALLLFENNVQRWIFNAEGKEGTLPEQKFQKHVTKKKDSPRNKNAAGEWNDEGMKRYNYIVQLIQRKRTETGREEFERAIKAMYEEEVDDDDEQMVAKKRRVEVNENQGGEEVVVINMFDASLCRTTND